MEAESPGEWESLPFVHCLGALGDPLLGFSDGGTVHCLNNAARELPGRYDGVGLTPEVWWWSLLNGAAANGLRDFFREVRAQGEPATMRDVFLAAPGKDRKVELAWDVAAFPAGPAGPGVVLLIRDRTPDRHLVETLRRERDFSHRLLRAAGALVVVLDRQGRIIRFNHACEALTGYQEEEVLGKSLVDLLLAPEERAGVLGVMEDLDAGNFPNQHENDWVTRSGERRRIRWTNTVIQSASGEILYLVGTGFDVTEQRQREARWRHQAVHDPLTGLANRVLLEELLQLSFHRAERNPGYLYGVLFLDLDGFKDINDRLGHPFGDLVLRAVADRLRRAVRKTDTVARFGGDEFVVLLEPLTGEGDLPVLADRVLRTLREPMETEGRTLTMTASIGMVTGRKGETSPADLLARADRAMYEAKRTGKSRSSFVPRSPAPME